MKKIYKIIIGKKVDKFFEKNKNLSLIFSEKLKILSLNPISEKCDIKRLKGEDNKYRLRIGKYRFLYEINNDEIFIYFYNAGSRGDIY